MIHQVFKLGLAKSIHHARVLIKQRHIRVRKQVHICEISPIPFHIDHFVSSVIQGLVINEEEQLTWSA